MPGSLTRHGVWDPASSMAHRAFVTLPLLSAVNRELRVQAKRSISSHEFLHLDFDWSLGRTQPANLIVIMVSCAELMLEHEEMGDRRVPIPDVKGDMVDSPQMSDGNNGVHSRAPEAV